MSTHQSAEAIDTSEMPAVHTFFRREFRLAGGVVRAVAPGDVARARRVAGHLDYLGRCLHHHHTAEDELAWPLLLERVPGELAGLVRLMESQHERVDALLAEIGPIRTHWAGTASAADRDRIAGLLDTLYSHLAEHLDAEEERLLPIAARTMTQAEWAAIGRHARSRTRRSEEMLTLGMIQHDADPVVLARMLSTAPAPVRRLLRWLARRAFRRYATRIHGTATP
jgi:hemerythrin-like domain-containing protein